jgi:hypothetical protein
MREDMMGEEAQPAARDSVPDGPSDSDLAVADRIIATTNPTSVLDVSIGPGRLAAALLSRGVDARELDASKTVDPPVEGHFSLVTCVDVLERLSPADSQALLDRICEASDRVLFSSPTEDFSEPANVNVQATATWAQWFAERGFFRRTDVSLAFLSPAAALFDKVALDPVALVHRYESALAPVSAAAHAKTLALLEAHRTIASLHEEITSLKLGGPDPERVARLAEEISTLQSEVVDARYDQLTVRDHVIGLEAENERLTDELERARARLNALRTRLDNSKRLLDKQRKSTRRLRNKGEELEKQLAAERRRAQAKDQELVAVRSSRTFKIGRALLWPVSVLRR